jgi:CRISPR-associated protein Cas1
MTLYITSYGTYIHSDGKCFVVECGGDKRSVSAAQVSSVVIGTAASFSTDAIHLAIKNNIDIVFTDRFGDPYGRIWHPHLGSTNLIRRKQLKLSESGSGLRYPLLWLYEKSNNQAAFLEELASRREGQVEGIVKEKVAYIKEHAEKFTSRNNFDDDDETACGQIRGHEGAVGRAYFAALSAVMPEKYAFDGRSHRPAKDRFNCVLNYAYGMLYSKVEKACIIAGLDPYCGFLHADNYAKISLVFDVIERYRIWAEKQAVFYFTGKHARDDHFQEVEGGFTLNKEGKKAFIPRMDEYLAETINYDGRRIERVHVIQYDCHKLAKEWLDT